MVFGTVTERAYQRQTSITEECPATENGAQRGAEINQGNMKSVDGHALPNQKKIVEDGGKMKLEVGNLQDCNNG